MMAELYRLRMALSIKSIEDKIRKKLKEFFGLLSQLGHFYSIIIGAYWSYSLLKITIQKTINCYVITNILGPCKAIMLSMVPFGSDAFLKHQHVRIHSRTFQNTSGYLTPTSFRPRMQATIHGNAPANDIQSSARRTQRQRNIRHAFAHKT